MDRQDALPPVPRNAPFNKGLPISPHPPFKRLLSSPPSAPGDLSQAGNQADPSTLESEDTSTSPEPIDHPEDFTGGEENGRDSVEDSTRRIEIISPKPQRDTINSVVDRYRHDTTYSEGEDDLDTEEQDENLRERRESVFSEESDVSLEPPPITKALFDLTPGREPSPARYKHGEPLHFGMSFFFFFFLFGYRG